MTSPPTLPAIWRPKVEIDWTLSGTFSGPYDNVTADTAADPGLSIDTGRDGGRSLNPPKVPSVDFELRNDHRRYSNEAPTSPVYQLVTPGTPVRVSATYGSVDRYRGTDGYRAHDPYRGVAYWALATARIDDVTQATPWGSQRVSVAALGTTSVLVGRTVTVAMQTNIRTDQAVTLVLDAAAWPSDKRAIAFGDTLLLYWWADERSAWELLVELLASEGPGALYEDAEGVLHFEGRNYRAVTPRCQTAQSTWFDIGSTPSDAYRTHDLYRAHDLYRGSSSSLYFETLDYSPGWRNIYARATYAVNRRTLGALAPVWAYGGDLTLSAGQVLTLFVRPQDPFQAAVTPALTTDYTVSSGAATVTLTYTSGFLAIITLTAGGAGAVVRGPAAAPGGGLQLRAQPLTKAAELTAVSTLSTTSSAATYLGIQTLAVAGWPEVDIAMASAVCDSWVARYNVQRPTVTLGIRAVDVQHFQEIVQRQVSDRIRLVERNTGIAADAWIEARHIELSGFGGRACMAVWACELCDHLSGDVWDGSTTLWDLAHWGR